MHIGGLPIFGTVFIAERGREYVSGNASEHKRGRDGYRTRWEHGDKDVWKEDEWGYMMTDKKAKERTQQQIISGEASKGCTV